jgi:Putative Ig domain
VLSGTPDLTGQADAVYSFTPTAEDADGDPLTFSVYGKPSWATFDESTGQLSGTPTDADVGTTEEIEIAVSDGTAQDTIGPFRIQIAAANTTPPPTNSAPTISGSPATSVIAGQAYSFAPVAQDADGDRLTFAIANRPQWASFNTATGRLTGTPSAAQVGTTSNIRISVSDGTATAALSAFSISVQAPPNGAPSISGAPATRVTAGRSYTFQPTASDPDGDTLVFTIQNKPSWASFDTANGRLSGTPASANVGTSANIRISVSDGTHSVSLSAFGITVTEAANEPPKISGSPPLKVSSGSAYTFTPTATDADGDTLTFSITNKPVWAAFSVSTGRLSGTPTAQQTGSYPGIVISVSDGDASASLPAFAITVSATPNRAPTINGSPSRNVVVGTTYAFTPTASDPDGDALTFSIQNMPAWATFSATTGRLAGTPGAQQIGTYSGILISVSDGMTSSSLSGFAITVAAAANRAPSISGTPATSVLAGLAYGFTPAASDPDGDTLTFSIQNKPVWASFSTSTGRLSGTPLASQIGNYPNIIISVSDGSASASLPAFAITVTAAANRAPSISGAPPQTVAVGNSYAFTPNAADADGERLTFSIQNRPGWATFSTSTGRLSGTPASTDVGTTSGIVISVTDGVASVSLAAFAITVSESRTGSALLTWTPPTLNTNGSALTNLAGYRIYYGNSANKLDRTQAVANPGLASYMIENLPSGPWYFVVHAYNSAGAESPASNIVNKTIP